MTDGPHMELSTTVLGAPDVPALAAFYQRLLGWERTSDEPEWVILRPPGDGTGLAFQYEADHVRPVWPPREGSQQMQAHLDIRVDDLEAGVAWAQACGAVPAEVQPQSDVVVMIDPAGHPFCLFEQ